MGERVDNESLSASTSKQAAPLTREEVLDLLKFSPAMVSVRNGHELLIPMDNIKLGKSGLYFPSTIAEYKKRFEEGQKEPYKLDYRIWVTNGDIDALSEITGGSSEDSMDGEWSRRAVNLWKTSGLWFVGRDQGENANVPLYLFCKTRQLNPVDSGPVDFHMAIPRPNVGKSSLLVGSWVTQRDSMVSYGVDKVVLDPYKPFEQVGGNEPADVKKLLESLPKFEEEGYETIGSVHTSTLEEIRAYADLCRDRNRAHLEWGFMLGSRFHFPNVISHGQRVVTFYGRDASRFAGAPVSRLNNVLFSAPIVGEVSLFESKIKPLSGNRFLGAVVDPELGTKYISLDFETSSQ